jgi:hypothetical protein
MAIETEDDPSVPAHEMGAPTDRLAPKTSPSDGCPVSIDATTVTPVKAPRVPRDLVATATMPSGKSVTVRVPGEIPMERLALVGGVAVTRAVTMLEMAMMPPTVDVEGLADAVAVRVVERFGNGQREALLVDYPQAARMLSTTVSALKTRMSRGDPKLHACVAATEDRTVRFDAKKLADVFTPKTARRRTT